jgi:hypothetical protein
VSLKVVHAARRTARNAAAPGTEALVETTRPPSFPIVPCAASPAESSVRTRGGPRVCASEGGRDYNRSWLRVTSFLISFWPTQTLRLSVKLVKVMLTW